MTQCLTGGVEVWIPTLSDSKIFVSSYIATQLKGAQISRFNYFPFAKDSDGPLLSSLY